MFQLLTLINTKNTKLTPAAVAAYDGKFIARDGHTETLEGNWLPRELLCCNLIVVEGA